MAQDCQAMLAIASASENYTQAEAYIVAGRICKERALPNLTGLVGSADSQLLMGVARAFVNTSSREAVSPLIALLQSPDPNIYAGMPQTAWQHLLTGSRRSELKMKNLPGNRMLRG